MKNFFYSISIFCLLGVFPTFAMNMTNGLLTEVLSSHILRNRIPGQPALISTDFKEFLKETSLCKVLQHADEQIVQASFNFDGSALLTQMDDTAKLWSTSHGILISILQHQGKIWTCSFTPDGNKVLTGSHDHTAKVWNAQTGKLIYDWRHEGPVTHIYVSPCGNKVLTLSNGQTATVWNIQTGAKINDFVHAENINIAAFNPQGTKILTHNTQGNTLIIWDIERRVREQGCYSNAGITKAIFSPDGSRVLSASGRERSLKLWNARTGDLINTFPTKSPLFHVGFGSEGTFHSEENDGVKIWDALSATCQHTLVNNRAYTNPIFSSDMKYVFTHADNHSSSKLWNAQTGEFIVSINYPFSNFDMSDDGSKLITFSSQSNDVKIWDMSGSNFYNIQKTSATNWVRFSKNGKLLLEFRNDVTSIGIWDARNGKMMHRFEPDGHYQSNLLICNHDSTLLVWRTQNGMELWNIPDQEVLEEFFRRPNINQVELLQAFELAKTENSKIFMDLTDIKCLEQYETFKSLPASVQRKLAPYLKVRRTSKPQTQNLEENPQSQESSSSSTSTIN